MSRPVLEVADIFCDHGAAWRRANVGHVSLDQMKVMSAIERCRTAALGGHVARCEDCPYTVIAYNSCRNRHCPKCQGTAAREWLAAREVGAAKTMIERTEERFGLAADTSSTVFSFFPSERSAALSFPATTW